MRIVDANQLSPAPVRYFSMNAIVCPIGFLMSGTLPSPILVLAYLESNLDADERRHDLHRVN